MVLLAAGAATAKDKPPKGPPPAAPPAHPARPAAAAPPPQPLQLLLNATEAEARTRLGPPDLSRDEGAGALWTYRLPDCALLVFFRGPEAGPLRVFGANASPRRRGEDAPTVNACIAAAMDRNPARPGT